MSAFNGPRAAADMRDVLAIREVVEREALGGALFRAEVRAFVARTEEELRAARVDRGTILRHLARLVVVPASEGLPAGVVYEPSPLVRRLSGLFGSRPSTTRLLLAATIAAALAGSLSACAAFGAAHAMIGVP